MSSDKEELSLLTKEELGSLLKIAAPLMKRYFDPIEWYDAGEGDMEKNSVVTVIKPTEAEKGVKKSSVMRCPSCGKKLELRGQTYACPSHGTLPFEPR